MFDVIAVGSATRDVFLQSRAFRVGPDKRFVSGQGMAVPLGSKIEVDRVAFETGGGGTNVAVAFARLGLRSAFIGKLGFSDARGQEILKRLNQEGVSTRYIARDRRHSTAYSVLLMTPTGERTALVYRGASGNFSVRDLPAHPPTARWMYITNLSGNLPLIRRLLRVAKQRQIRIAWNPGAAELALGLPTLRPLLRQVSVLVLNHEEASALTKIPYEHDRRIFESLCIHLPGVVVITEGRQGASVCDNRQKFFSVPKSVTVRNTTGAGDAFGSGFVAGLILRKNDLRFALQLGTANAESVIQSFGAKEGLLRRIPPASRLCRVRVVSFPNP